MPSQVSKIFNLISNMGWRYLSFRIRHEVLKKTGLLKHKFPVNPKFKQYIDLEQWKSQDVQFFFRDKESLTFPKDPASELKSTFENIRAGKYLLFNSILADLGINYDWITNPDSGFRYDIYKHWTEIADFSKEAGDIKYTWEKSRFSYLFDIIRYDYHFKQDCSQQVFKDILSWVKSNPVNCGPNYRCSQEISLRILNWTFALHYYKNSPNLTVEVFSQIQFAIYWQIHHVRKNIDFSRIAVRNNHAITETLSMYLVGLLYPTLPDAAALKSIGKKWFEEEIAYQVYEDGTFLQFSMNYHRVVVQLLTWAITLSEKNNERFDEVVYDRAKKSLKFLGTCMIDANGWLPNYGNNDGALFFKLSNTHFRDYRSQLTALANALGMSININLVCEDSLWYGNEKKVTENWQPLNGIHSFDKGGYYIIRETDTLTFIRCGNHKDRPHQADNLHIDIWHKDKNILIDAGSYKYNTDDATLRYFSGTQSHNTVMLDENDQMLKGSRFIWYYWTQCSHAILQDNKTAYTFGGEIKAFQYINKNILHRRYIIKAKGKLTWIIKDHIMNVPQSMTMKQLWHIPLQSKNCIKIAARNEKDALIELQKAEGWYSSLYGQKEKTNEYYFCSDSAIIETTIEVAD